MVAAFLVGHKETVELGREAFIYVSDVFSYELK